jgi:hypothetical protein
VVTSFGSGEVRYVSGDSRNVAVGLDGGREAWLPSEAVVRVSGDDDFGLRAS